MSCKPYCYVCGHSVEAHGGHECEEVDCDCICFEAEECDEGEGDE